MEAIWLPHPGVWVTKGSSFPITLNGPDKHCLHSLETVSNKWFPYHEVGSHVQNHAMSCNFFFCFLLTFFVSSTSTSRDSPLGATTCAMQGDRWHGVYQAETCRGICSLQSMWLTHLRIKACQALPCLHTFSSIFPNTVNLSDLDQL